MEAEASVVDLPSLKDMVVKVAKETPMLTRTVVDRPCRVRVRTKVREMPMLTVVRADSKTVDKDKEMHMPMVVRPVSKTVDKDRATLMHTEDNQTSVGVHLKEDAEMRTPTAGTEDSSLNPNPSLSQSLILPPLQLTRSLTQPPLLLTHKLTQHQLIQPLLIHHLRKNSLFSQLLAPLLNKASLLTSSPSTSSKHISNLHINSDLTSSHNTMAKISSKVVAEVEETKDSVDMATADGEPESNTLVH